MGKGGRSGCELGVSMASCGRDTRPSDRRETSNLGWVNLAALVPGGAPPALQRLKLKREGGIVEL